MTKKFIIAVAIFLTGLSATAQAETVTISKVPPELARLRATYVSESKQQTTNASITKFKKEYNNAKSSAKRTPVYTKQRSILEQARDRDLKVINDRYQASLTKLDKATLTAIDKKYQKQLALLQSRTAKRLKVNYLADLKVLEKKLIAQNNLAGALLVQNERKALGAAGAMTGAAANAKPKKRVKKAKAAAKKTVKKATKPLQKLSENNPQVYSSTTIGLAGSGKNNINNVYTFDVRRLGKQAILSFQAWGTKTNNSKGDVYLIDSSGKRHKVATWSPKNLKASTFYDVRGAQDIEPIETDISSLFSKTGTYKVLFKYRDGNEALKIYKVSIQTW